MAHPNERAYLAKFLKDWPVSGWLKSLDGARILNVGSADYGSATDYASLFPGRQVVGVDQKPGKGVDLIYDITSDHSPFGQEKFAAILCCSVLEHCEHPWRAAANLENLLLPAGLLYVTVPWIWRYHPYPKDYWRFSEDGIRLLFPRIVWKRIDYMTQGDGEVVPKGTADGPPWRFPGPRVYLSSQMLHMIGRLA